MDYETLAICAIQTTAPNAAIAPLQYRMPIVIMAPDWPLWLVKAGHGEATLMRAVSEDSLCFEQAAPL